MEEGDPKKARRRLAGEAGVVLGFLALAGLVFQQTRTSFVEQGAASGGAMFNAAMFPELLAWSLVLLSAIQLVDILRSAGWGRDKLEQYSATPPPGGGGSEGNRSLGKAFVCAALFVIYLAMLRPLGYHLTTPLFMAGTFYVLGTRNVLLVMLLAIGTSLAMSFIFEYWMNVILPVGMFGIGF